MTAENDSQGPLADQFVCPTCGRKGFSTSGNLQKHIRLAHGVRASKETTGMAETTTTAEAKKPTISQPTPAPSTAPAALTPDERALVDQVTRSTDDWTAITEESMLDFSLAEDQLKLPPEAKDRQDRKEYAYRWCERTPKRVAELTNASPPLRWWVANATTAPYLKKYVDPTIGGVCRLDQILLLKPWGMHQKVKDAVLHASKALYNSRELDKGGAQKVSNHNKDYVNPVVGERAGIRGPLDGTTVLAGERDDVGELVAAD